MKTFGQKLIGITDKTGNDNLDKVNQMFAEIADIVKSVHADKNATRFAVMDTDSMDESEILNTLYIHTMGELVSAQINIAKLITLKY